MLYKIYTIMIFYGCDQNEDMKCMVEDIVVWAFELWSLVPRTLGIQWVLPEKVHDFLCGWRNWGPNLLLDKWNLVPLCLLWTIWKEKNRHSFEDVEFTSTQLLASFISSLYEWSFVSSLIDGIYVQSFIESIHI